jgi:YebC/PmpR family DNA-binding regulatory protein
MAGHSKWANIKHRKGAQDKKRGKIFTKLIREITIAAKLGGDDSNSNPRLRTAMDKAFASNMPKNTIQRAIARGVKNEAGDTLEEVRYEGYGPHGIAVIVNCLTDNKNRTVAEVRHTFTKAGGNLGTEGSVAYLFQQKGVIDISITDQDENKIMELAIDAGAEDIQPQSETQLQILTLPEELSSIVKALKAADCVIDHAEITFVASTNVDITEIDAAEKIIKFLSDLDDLDDVQDIYSNANIEKSLLEKLKE